MSESLAVLEEQYFLLKENLPALLDAATDEQQRKDLRAQYKQARNNYWAAQNKVLNENDPKVQQAAAGARAHQKSMEAALQHLTNVATTLDIITGAVSAGTHLVSMLG
jgi:hypothetical protein